MFVELLEEITKEDEELELLNENNTADRSSIRSQFKRLFGHLLKWKYQPTKQYSRWIDTIRNAVVELNEIKTKNPTEWGEVIPSKIDQYYNLGINLAVDETGLDRRTFPKTLPEELSLPYVIDLAYIESYMKKYAYTDEVKKLLGSM